MIRRCCVDRLNPPPKADIPRCVAALQIRVLTRYDATREPRGRDMRRREFIRIVASAAAMWPLAVFAQQSKVARIGALYIGTADAESFRKELREGLRELGYIEGQTI